MRSDVTVLDDRAPERPRAQEASALALRPYQLEAVERASAALEGGKNPVVVLPTGAGKSIVLAELARRHIHLEPLILAHRQELVEQDAAAVERITGMPPAVICAGLGRDDQPDTAPIVVASVQTLASRIRASRAGGGHRLVIVDEAHLVPPDQGSMYQTVIGHYAGASIVGLSATPYRLTDGPIVAHPDIPFDTIAIEVPAATLVEHGYLSPVILDDRSQHAIATAGVQIRGGEFALGALERAAAVADLVSRQIADASEAARDRRSILVFTVSRGHAELVAATLEARGETVAVVTEGTSPRERAAILDRFRAGEVRWLVNIDVLTTGFDAPNIDAIVCLRPTCSKSLFVQMIGRGFRIAPNKRDCLVLDYGGNIARHEPIDEIPGERRVDGQRRAARSRSAPSSDTTRWHDRVLGREVEWLGEHLVLDWRVDVEPSRSVPGTMQVRVRARLRGQNGRERSVWVWYTPEHTHPFARYRALQAARTAGWRGSSISAEALARLLRRAYPGSVGLWSERSTRGTFHRIVIGTSP